MPPGTMAIGFIADPQAAEAILVDGDADLVALARGALEDPNWAVHARHALGGADDAYRGWPKQAANRIREKDLTLRIREFAG